MSPIALSIPDMQRNAGQAEKLLKLLANSHRLMILCHLLEGELTVGELERRVGLSQSALSQHLARLRQEGILAVRREGTSAFYRVHNPDALALLETLHRLYCGA